MIGPILRGRVGPAFPRNVEYGDIVAGLPLGRGTCRAVYGSHVLEHLSLHDLRVALGNVHAYLEDGGRFRLVVPDLEWLARDYLDPDSPSTAMTFMKSSGLGRETRPRSLAQFVRAWMGNSTHLWMWDYEALSIELARAGFRNVRRASFGDSTEPEFVHVEARERWEKCLGVECTK